MSGDESVPEISANGVGLVPVGDVCLLAKMGYGILRGGRFLTEAEFFCGTGPRSSGERRICGCYAQQTHPTAAGVAAIFAVKPNPLMLG